MVSDETGQQDRQRIVEAALEKFRRHGIRRVTMAEIARELRVSKKTLYRHFAGKDEIVAACVEAIAAALFPALLQAVEEPVGARQRIIEWWKVVATVPRLLSSELVADLAADHPRLWGELHRRRMEVFARFEAVVEAGIRDGEVRPGIHPRVFAALMRAVLEHVVVPETLVAYEFTPSDAVTTLLTLFEKGLLCEEVPR